MEMQTIKELAQGRTQFGDIQGAAHTMHTLEPAIWLQVILDAAKQRFYFLNFCYITELQKGQKEVVIPYRTIYKGGTPYVAGPPTSGITYATAAPADGTAITATVLDNFEGITITPAMQASRITISNYAIQVNAIDLIRAAQEELVYSIGDKVDQYIAVTIGNALGSSATVHAATTLFGGSATRGSLLAAGDVMTTDLVADARKALMSRYKEYRTANTGAAGGGTGAVAGTILGNPWVSSPDGPFVLFIGPAQELAFLKDSQFVNAAEYGSNKVIMNGEIGEYIGVKIISTNNVEQVAVGSAVPDATGGNALVNMTRCVMIKAQKAAAFCWGKQPSLRFWDNVPQVSQDVVMESAYAASVVYDDAIVFIDVADA
jgi:N4-gp56 family major capsid protein